MVSLGRKLQQRPSLWILYLLSIWVLGTQANFVDVNSCSNWRQYSDTRGNIRSYGNKLTQVESAVSETAKMTTEASQAIAAVKAKTAGFFDRMRTLMLFFALFGDAGGQQAWDDAYSKIQQLQQFFANRHSSRTPQIYCGDAHLELFHILKVKGKKYTVKDIPEGGERDVVGFRFRDPILARDPNANRWWPENERPCEPSDDHFALGADFKYVILCHKALEQNGVTIGSDRRVNWASSRYATSKRRYLEHWAYFTSYSVLHEFIHNLFRMRDISLRRPAFSDYKNRWHRVAYKFYAAVALLFQKASEVDINVDTLGMLILGLFMKACSWSEGTAESAAQIEAQCQ